MTMRKIKDDKTSRIRIRKTLLEKLKRAVRSFDTNEARVDSVLRAWIAYRFQRITETPGTHATDGEAAQGARRG